MRRTSEVPPNTPKKPTKKEKRLYVVLNEDDLSAYKTITASKDTQTCRILQKAVLYNTNESGSLRSFPLKRRVVPYDELKNMYHYHWEYFASFSPLWKARINQYGGLPDHDERKIVFEDEQLSQEFYDNYGYEPDELSVEIQEKNIPIIHFTSEIESNNDGLLMSE